MFFDFLKVLFHAQMSKTKDNFLESTFFPTRKLKIDPQQITQGIFDWPNITILALVLKSRRLHEQKEPKILYFGRF